MSDENKMPSADLPADLPENWKLNDAISPDGTDTGKTEKHGYNYLMKAVNLAHKKLNQLITHLSGMHRVSYTGSYADLESKPSTFPPSSHTHTKGQVGLDKVDNTSDIAKPISNATNDALSHRVVKNSVRSSGGASNSYIKIGGIDSKTIKTSDNYVSLLVSVGVLGGDDLPSVYQVSATSRLGKDPVVKATRLTSYGDDIHVKFGYANVDANKNFDLYAKCVSTYLSIHVCLLGSVCGHNTMAAALTEVPNGFTEVVTSSINANAYIKGQDIDIGAQIIVSGNKQIVDGNGVTDIGNRDQMLRLKGSAERPVYLGVDENGVTFEPMALLKDVPEGSAGDTLPIGAMLPSNNKTSKDGWLVCDGSLISRVTYSELFAVIGTRYGAGNGTTTFALPNGPDLVAHSVDAKGVSHLEPLASGTCMIIKAKQLVPIVASVIDDINSTSNTDALSVMGVKNLMDKRALSYIKVPTKYTVNQFNIVFHNNPIDVNTLCDGCRHRVPSGSANLPVDGYCYIDSIVADTGYGYQYAHLTRGNQVYMREYCANVFSGWQLISGQVVLWSGNAQAKDTVLTLSSDISMYGHVNVITGDGWALDGVVHGNSLIMASVSYVGASGAIINGCVTLQIVDNKHLKLYSDVSELSNTTSDHTIASKQHITAIIGRP